MASSAHRQNRSGASTGPQPLALVELIDAYATARAGRDECYRDAAAWAFDSAHAAMLTARAAVTEALGIPADGIPAPRDRISRAADARIAAVGGAL